MLTPKDTPPFLCDINSADDLDEDFDSSLEEAFSHFEGIFQDIPLSALFCAEKGMPLPEGAPLGGTAIPYRKAIWEWPHDAQTGEKLPWGTPLEKGKVITLSLLQKRWPHDAQTGEKLPWGTPLEKGKVLTYTTLKSRWPHDAQTGEKLAWETPLKKGEVLRYGAFQDRWPHDAQTGEKLPWGTPLKKGKVVPYTTLKSRWPYDAQTSEKLPWGTPLKKGKVVTYTSLRRHWPHDARTGEKLPWGTPLKKGKVVTYSSLRRHWPHDAATGEKLSLDNKIDGESIVSYEKLLTIRPTNKLTGVMSPYGTRLGGDIVKSYEFKMHYTFVGSDGKTYKGLNAKEKALEENPGLCFKSKKELKSEKQQSLRKKKSSGDVLAIKETSNPRKRSKQSLIAPESSSSCIDTSAHQKNNALASRSFPLIAENFDTNYQDDQRLEFEPLSPPMFLPGLEQQVPTSNDNSYTDIEECGLSPSILFSGPGG